MTYIGNARTPLIYASNKRDDIVPDGTSSTFNLSTEVSGGDENNISVIRRKYLLDTLVTGSALLTITNGANTVTCSNAALASTLSIVQPPIPNVWGGDLLVISGCTNPINNGTFPVISVTYDGATISIVIAPPASPFVTETGGSITLKRGYVGAWEILEPEIDYSIGGVSPNYNKQITFTTVPQIDDVLYVLHKAEGTYNFVPSPSSVGPDQLQSNLRNFVVNRFTGNGATTVYTLSQAAVNSRAILVSVAGVLLDGNDPDTGFDGDWVLNAAGTQITFDTAPANLAKIKVTHLGFSTVSRRAALSPGQVGAIASGSVGTLQLAPAAVDSTKLASAAVTNSAIAADAVTGSKILLANNDPLRGTKSAGGAQNLIKISGTDKTEIDSLGDTIINRAGTNHIYISATSVVPKIGGVSLGTTGDKWVDGKFSGDVSSATSNTTGNATVGGNIIVTGTVDGVDVSALNSSVTSLSSLVSALLPPGVIVPYAGPSAPNSNWLICDGTAYSRVTYSALFAAISTTYGTGDGSTTFNIPDLRQRFPLGKAASGTGSVLGATGGSIDHTHTSAAHTHGLASHTHTISNHTHTLSAHTHIGPSHFHGMKSHTHTISHNHSIDSETSFAAITAYTQGQYISYWERANFGFTANSLMTINGASPAFTYPTTGSPQDAVKVYGNTNGSSAASSGAPNDNNTTNAGDALTTGPNSDVTGPSGTLTSNGPSTNVSDSGGAAATTSNNPPFLVTNYIIKT